MHKTLRFNKFIMYSISYRYREQPNCNSLNSHLRVKADKIVLQEKSYRSLIAWNSQHYTAQTLLFDLEIVQCKEQKILQLNTDSTKEVKQVVRMLVTTRTEYIAFQANNRLCAWLLCPRNIS